MYLGQSYKQNTNKPKETISVVVAFNCLLLVAVDTGGYIVIRYFKLPNVNISISLKNPVLVRL